ncbi:MAG: hypothetical protein ACRCV5_06495, partial [Afipia sp.]
MGLLNVIRRLALREQVSIREIARRTGLSRNTIKKYLKAGTVEPKFAVRERPSKLDPFADKLAAWLKTETAKSRKQRRTLKQLHNDLVALGYAGSYNRVAAFARQWRVDRQRAHAGGDLELPEDAVGIAGAGQAEPVEEVVRCPGGSGADEGGAPGRGGLQQRHDRCHFGPGGAADGVVIQSNLPENRHVPGAAPEPGQPRKDQVRPVRPSDSASRTGGDQRGSEFGQDLEGRPCQGVENHTRGEDRGSFAQHPTIILQKAETEMPSA